MERPPTDGNRRGALWILASGFAFSLSITLIKFLGAGYPATVQTFFRQLVSLLILLPWILRDPRGVLTTTRPWYMLGRTAATSLSIILVYSSYQSLTMAQGNALSFTRALFMAPLAVFILHERVGAMRIAASAVGFAGVLVILQPGSDASLIGLPALFGLLAALLTAWSVIGVKAMSRDHSQITLLAWSGLLGTMFTLPPALLDWHTPGAMDLALLALMGLLSTISQACYTRGMTQGDTTVLAPLDYARIIYTSLFGYLFFREIPGWHTLAGCVVIIAAAIFITLHARRQEQARLVEAEGVV